MYLIFQKIQINKGIIVYPNPAKESITILSEEQHNIEFHLLDVQGRNVLTGILKEKETVVAIDSLVNGTYTLVFQNPDIEEIRIIKQ